MSSTRRASKRARLARRAENDAIRTARRDSLAVLLSRTQRNVPLTADEAALLRAAVEAEIREGDAARTSERGQQRAADRERERVTAAEAAIVEAEERARVAEERLAGYEAAEKYRQAAADTFAGRLDAIRQQTTEGIAAGIESLAKRAETAEAALDRVHALAADMRTWASPHGIATQYADDIERALAEQPRAAVDVTPGVAVIRDRDAEQRADQAEQRATDLLQRAERAEQDRAALATELQATRARAANTEAGDTAALRLAESTTRQWKERAQEAEEQAAQQCARANAWRGHAIETDDRADRHHAAWRNARKRAAERTAQRDRAEQALASAREERARALAAHLAATEPTR